MTARRQERQESQHLHVKEESVYCVQIPVCCLQYLKPL